MQRDPRQVLTEWLVLASQGGDEQAFTELHALWREDLRRLALVRVERPEAAEEVVNNVWLAIARGLSRLHDPACFPRWAFRIVERRSADWVRQRRLARRREGVASREVDALAPAPLEPADEPDEVQRLRAAVTRLPEGQRELIHLFYDAERSVAEIAEVLGIPAGTVKSRLSSVREHLKQQLERKLP